MSFFLKLIVMIVLGILSAALSYYRRNYYVRVFDDILGKEEDENTTTRVGRGFIYGFFFPVYFVLLLGGLIALIWFLIVAGVIVAITFVIVWVTEKILPFDWFGNTLVGLFKSLGLSGTEASAPPPAPASPQAPPSRTSPEPPKPDKPAPAPQDKPSEPSSSGAGGSSAFPGGGINRTRVHKLD